MLRVPDRVIDPAWGGAVQSAPALKRKREETAAPSVPPRRPKATTSRRKAAHSGPRVSPTAASVPSAPLSRPSPPPSRPVPPPSRPPAKRTKPSPVSRTTRSSDQPTGPRLSKDGEVYLVRLPAKTVAFDPNRYSSTRWGGKALSKREKAKFEAENGRGYWLLKPRDKPVLVLDSSNNIIAVLSNDLGHADTALRLGTHLQKLEEGGSFPKQKKQKREGAGRSISTGSTRGRVAAESANMRASKGLREAAEGEDMRLLSGNVTALLEKMLPELADRLRAMRTKARPGEEAKFGLLHMAATDVPKEGKNSVSKAHTDQGNASNLICGVLTWASKNHDATRLHRLTFPTLRMSICVPAGHVALFPSALLPHMNTRAEDYKEGEDIGMLRGSFVFWTPAEVAKWFETGRVPQKEAKDKVERKWSSDNFKYKGA